MKTMTGQAGNGRGLVLVRVGADHRIAGLLNVPRQKRDWDLAVSLYEEVPFADDACIDFLHCYRGGKWDGIHAFFAENPELLARYDYFWLVDDDIEVTPAQVDKLFDYVRIHDFELAQPALTLDSYYSYRLTLHCPGFLHRYTNFVEIMAPVLSRHVLENVIPHFANTRSGLGIDWHWHDLVARPERGIAIIDAVPVGHRRPLRQHLRGKMREDGVCPDMEMKRLVEALELKRVFAIAKAGVLRDRRTVESRFQMACMMTWAYWLVRDRITARPWSFPEFVFFGWRQMFMSLSQ
ncbi:MAG: DUF707 domain-containing protein [Methylococcaceae bacterium]|nr:MAG: DUF707 domain-containing protein [Methylococcaceae bacterium]